MTSNESYQKWLREVFKRTKELKNAMNQMLLVLASQSEASRYAQAESLSVASESLCTIIVEKDWPHWLKPLDTAIAEFLAHQSEEKARQLISTIVMHLGSVNQNSVLPNADGESPYRFDDFYEQARNQANVSDLFDAHIQAISTLIDSGAIESVTVLNALIQLVATLKANRNASYSAVKQTVFFAKFVQNSVLIGLKKVPGLGILVEAAEKTLKDAEHGVGKLEQEMNAMLMTAVSGNLPRIQNASVIIEQQIKALPSPDKEHQLAK
jgi:hypothetical protein